VKLKRLIGLVLGAGILTLGAWGSVELYRTANEAPAEQMPTTAVKRGNVTFAVYAKGELQGGNSKMLSAPMVGGVDLSLTSLRSPGELVKAGDTVAEFDTTDQVYKLREAEADLAEADQKVIQARAQMQAKEDEDAYLLIKARYDVKLAELEVRRNELVSVIQAKQADLALQAARDILTQLERDLGNRKATSEAGVQIQAAGQTKAKVQAETARKNIEMMTLRAPADGYVNVQSNMNTNFFQTGMQLPMLQVGDTVRAGMAVVQIPDLHSWEVLARLSEADRGHLEKGQAVRITAVAVPDHPFSGKVVDLGGTTGPQWDRRFECRISLENPTPELRPGMTASLVITAETMNDALWIPAQALFESDGRSFVYVQAPKGGFTTQDVKLVRRSESQVVITGMTEGQVVALASPDRSKDKDKGTKSPASATQALPGR
jgi:HlyD family secretion protein